MKTIYVTRVNNDINGNPVYEVCPTQNEKLNTLGRKKRNSIIRRITSYSIERDISDHINENVKIEICY